jgi:meiotic recombination protein SPO11
MTNSKMSKRDVYYSSVTLFQDQEKSNKILLQLSRALMVQPESLHILAAPKGLIYGKATWKTENGQVMSAEKLPKLISFDTYFPSITTDAPRILVVEKESIFQQLVNYPHFQRLNCLLITAKGYPDVATRNFLSALLHNTPSKVYILYALGLFHFTFCTSTNNQGDIPLTLRFPPHFRGRTSLLASPPI